MWEILINISPYKKYHRAILENETTQVGACAGVYYFSVNLCFFSKNGNKVRLSLNNFVKLNKAI